MKAAITEGDGKIRLAEVPKPEPDNYQCLCKVLACATCTGTDQKIIAGELPWEQDYPGILGHESVGQVVKVGEKVRNIKKGDIFLRPTAVYPGEKLGDYYSLWGGFAEYGLITDTRALQDDRPQADLNNYTRYQQKLPRDMAVPPAEATMLITLKELSSFLMNLKISLNSSLVILGAGNVAMAVCFFAKILGCGPVIVVSRRDKPLLYIKKLGADFTINNQQENMIERVRELTAGQGADYLIDTTGNRKLVIETLPLLAPGGKIVPYAVYANDAPFKDFDQNKFIFAGPSEELAHQYLLNLLKLKCVPLKDFYSHRLPFSEIRTGFELLKKKEAFKIIFEMEE